MLATGGGFVAICPKKEVELGADRLIHRALHAEELRQEIEFPCSKAVTNQYAHMCGGALRAINPNNSMTMAEMETCAAVFKGNLFNKAELALQLVGCPPQLNEAQLLLHLYAAKGLDMLGMLQGQYAFCLYDSKQARVFAARDHSGAVPLLEGRTAAGSLIIACGTFLPEGVYQLVDIQPGQYKYGWHALPRDFKCGSHKIVSGRASCDYGIRRRSIDAFNASPSTPNSRGKSLDIPGMKHHSHGTGSTTPGRYVPPHASGGSFYSRQRATSLDSGHWGSHQPVSASLPSPQAGHTFGGRRRTSENNGHNGSAAAHASGAHASKEHHSPKQQQHHHAAKPAPNPSAAAAAPASHAPAAAAKAAAAALAAAAAATSALSPAAPASSSKEGASAPLHVAIPAGAAANALSPGSDVSGAGAAGSEASIPMSGGADMASPHRRRRRHRSRKHKANGSTADGSVDASSDTESQISTSTHDSANFAPTAVPAAGSPAAPAAPAAGGGKPKSSPVAVPSGGRRKSEAGSTGKAGHQGKPAAHSAGAAHEKPDRRSHQPNKQHHQQPQQQWQPKAKQAEGAPDAAEQRRSSSSGSGSGFKRNGSCGELAALGSSPTPRPVLQVAPQGLAC